MKVPGSSLTSHKHFVFKAECENPGRPIIQVIGIKDNNYPKYFFILLAIAISVVVFLIIRPFITAILSSAIIAYVFYPIYNFLNKKIKRRNLSALLVTIFIVILIVVPLFFVINTMSKEAYVIYLMSKQKIIGGGVSSLECNDADGGFCVFSGVFSGLLGNPKIMYQLEEFIKKATNFVIDTISRFIVSIPIILLNFFIMIFVAFYLLRDGHLLISKIQKILPLKKSHQEHVFKKFEAVIRAVIYGQVSVALIQGALGTIGFIIFGVASPFLWGSLMAFFALLPFIGPPGVWLPIAILQILDGYSAGNTSLVIKGILLILYGTLIIGTIDNILKPKLISDKADIHPVLVLLGVLGGLKIFGFIGIVVGPLLLALFMAFVKIYEEEKSETQS